jgi:hypothetical protein
MGDERNRADTIPYNALFGIPEKRGGNRNRRVSESFTEDGYGNVTRWVNGIPIDFVRKNVSAKTRQHSAKPTLRPDNSI